MATVITIAIDDMEDLQGSESSGDPWTLDELIELDENPLDGLSLCLYRPGIILLEDKEYHDRPFLIYCEAESAGDDVYDRVETAIANGIWLSRSDAEDLRDALALYLEQNH